MDKLIILLKSLEPYCYRLVTIRRKYAKGELLLDDVVYELRKCMDDVKTLYSEIPYPVYEFLKIMDKALRHSDKEKILDTLYIGFSKMLREQGNPRTICSKTPFFPYDVVCRFLGYQVKKTK